MADEKTYVFKPRDPDAIVKLQDPAVIEKLLDEPMAVLAGVVAEYIKSGNGFFATAGLRLVQAAFKGELFQQVGREIDDLRAKGKLPDDLSQNKNGYKSWIELLTILDEESPDEERLDALKAMFFAVNRVGIGDQQRMLHYQLFQTAKRMTSGELLLLKAVYESFKNGSFDMSSTVLAETWAANIANRVGHGLAHLVLRDSLKLEQLGLITATIPGSGRAVTSPPANMTYVDPRNGRITDLGIRFCENIETYHVEKIAP